MQKRALPSTSSGQPSQPRKPCLAPTNQVWHLGERNLVPRSFLTEEDVWKVVIEELERAKSHTAEYCQRSTRQQLFMVSIFMDIVHSLENAVQNLHLLSTDFAQFLLLLDDLWNIKTGEDYIPNKSNKAYSPAPTANDEVPNLSIDMNSWERSTYYPYSNFYVLSSGPSTQHRRITEADLHAWSMGREGILIIRKPCILK